MSARWSKMPRRCNPCFALRLGDSVLMCIFVVSNDADTFDLEQPLKHTDLGLEFVHFLVLVKLGHFFRSERDYLFLAGV